MKQLLLILSIGLLAIGCSPERYSENKVTENNDIVLDTDGTPLNGVVYQEYENGQLKEEENPLGLDSRYKYSESDLKKFNNWVDQTLRDSDLKNNSAIVIDKSAYTLYLIDDGKVHSKYFIEMGGNPYDDKQREGDSCTPEGMYKITAKKDQGSTSFYKAFLINYPNQEDLKKGKTGSLIEVHGSGSGKAGNNGGGNWTLGCMATSNENIDELFNHLKKEDKITIVKYTNKLKLPAAR